VLPGVHRVGVGAGTDIKLANDESTTVYTMLEWAGAPYEAELQPLALDGSVRVNGHVLQHRVRLVPGTQIELGPFRLELVYPKTMTLRR